MGKSKPWIGKMHAAKSRAKKYKSRDDKHKRHHAPPQDYLTRWYLLRELGFENYQDYLNSDLWKGIRSRILRPGSVCKLCGDKPFCVHHLGYGRRTLLGKNLSPLVPICKSCHTRIEFNGDKKNSIKEMQACYASLLEERKRQLA